MPGRAGIVQARIAEWIPVAAGLIVTDERDVGMFFASAIAPAR